MRIASQAVQLAQRAETQASSLSRTTAAMQDMAAAVDSNTALIGQGRSLSQQASSRASRGGDVVSRAISVMAEIKASSAEISEIVSVIEGIAFQTNLLSLNASVEAARAGEAGKGFAVVASEVRALAQRSSDASKNISTLIQKSEDQVALGVDVVTETNNALNDIVSAIQEVEGTIEDISGHSTAQTTQIEEVKAVVSQADAVTRENAAMAASGTETAQLLLESTKGLETAIGDFLHGGQVVAQGNPEGRAAA